MLLGKPTPPSRRSVRSAHRTTTLRDFSGGWNVVDNELTLSPKYARIFDNMQRAPDGSVTIRPGYKLWKDLHSGVETTVSTSVAFETVLGSRIVKVFHNFHGMSLGNHVAFWGVDGGGSGLVNSELNSTHDIREIVDSNSYRIAVPTAPTANGTFPATGNVTKDTHPIGGSIVSGFYFQEHLILVSDTGEIVKISDSGTATRIWSQSLALALSGTPVGWTQTQLVSFHVNGGNLLVHNDVDKPLDINLARAPNVIFLGDPASGGSNAAVPLGHLGFTSGGYAIVAGSPSEESLLQFSASLAPGVYTGNPAPDDATDIDLSKSLNIPDPKIIGITELRDKLLVVFRDKIAIGLLGGTKTIGSDIIHDPDFKDSIPEHGAISHRSIVPLGNDVFMCSRTGIPSVAQSQISATFLPRNVSDLISPALQQNINRLSDDVLLRKVFAVYNAQERQYMLFMPKYDSNDIRELDADPIIFTSILEQGKYIIKVPSHGFDEGDKVIVAGSTTVGLNGNINGTWPISEVISEDYIVVETGTTYTTTNEVGGGSSVTLQPVNEETIGYIFAYNPELKVRAWSRYRNLNFDYGIKTPSGSIFFGKGGKIYRFGDRNNPITSDDGQAIKFVWEWPWGDFDTRVNIKEISSIYPDTLGKAQFDFKLFVDQLYKSSVGVFTPARATTFTGSSGGGFGAGNQPYGGGRRGKEQVVWPIPVIGKLIKPRIEGETTDPIRFVSLTILYREGTVGR